MKNILLVDDEKIITDTLSAQLIDNYYCDCAQSGDEALDILEDYDNDEKEIYAVISDWLMPGMKGDELLISISVKYPNIKLILLSGQADPEALHRLESYPCEVIRKPWVKADLINLLK
jgi:CheY-like chemotaxis protein